MTKKIYYLMCIAIIMCTTVYAQDQAQRGRDGKKPNIEQMHKKKIKEIIKALSLDNQNAQMFTEVYTEYQKQVREIKEKYQKTRPTKGEDGTFMELMDEEVEENILKGFKEEKELLDLKEKYYTQYRKFLSPQQIQKMYMLDNRGPQAGRMQYGRPNGGFPGGGFTPPPGGFGGGFGPGF